MCSFFAGDENYFKRREFSFTLHDDIYLRYQSFSDSSEFRQSLVKKNPVKIDIGAVFKNPPKDAKKNFEVHEAQERELIFDIDMDDYDEIRTCCNGPSICKLCWKFMMIGVEIIDKALREDFGFQHILWVFSGRRGIHAWVSDERARLLSTKARDAIVSYLSLVQGGQNEKRVELPNENLHPMVIRALTIIDKYFNEILVEQKWLTSADSLKQFIALCVENSLQAKLREGLSTIGFKPKPEEAWRTYRNIVNSHNKGRITLSNHLISEIKIQMCYPRLDVNVSKGINHLLKAPFCIHPKTGNVCVPIDIKNFDLEKVPTLKELIAKTDLDSTSETKHESSLYDKTPLKSSINLFERYIKGYKSATLKIKREASESTLEF